MTSWKIYTRHHEKMCTSRQQIDRSAVKYYLSHYGKIVLDLVETCTRCLAKLFMTQKRICARRLLKLVQGAVKIYKWY